MFQELCILVCIVPGLETIICQPSSLKLLRPPLDLMNAYPQYWWHEYRRERYRPRTRLGHEMIFRRTYIESLKEFTHNCSLSGVGKLCDSNIGYKIRLFWLIITCTVIVTLTYCLSFVWSGLSKPLIVSMESTTYGIQNIDFPGVALCNINRVSNRGSRIVAKFIFEEIESKDIENRKIHYTWDKFDWLIKQTGRFLDFEFSEAFEEILNSFDVRDLNDFDTSRIAGIMKLVSPDCSQMLIKCAWNGEIRPCSELFDVRRTARGHCCTFNYVLEYNGSGGIIGDVKRQKIHGAINGLNVIMDPQIDDYAYPLHPMQGIEVFLFDPKHFPDFSGGKVIHRFVEPNQMNRLEIQSRVQVATSEVRKYYPETRNCLFHDELKEYGQKYSMSTCIIRCRIKAVQDLCKCTPYFLPIKSGPVCSIDDVHCLNKHKEKFLYLYPQNPETWAGLEREFGDSIFCPQCLPDCEHTQYYTKGNRIPLGFGNDAKYFWGSFTHNVNLTNKCVLSVYQSTSDGILDRLDVVSYWFELLSNVGGFGGILLGFSLVAIVELIYYLFVRFIVVLRTNYKRYY